MEKAERFDKIIEYFQIHRPEAESELNYKNPYELMVAVVLSAQCTDKRVNIITPAFFKRFPTVNDLAESDAETVFEYIKSCSFANNKTKHLIGAARILVYNYDGIIPSNIEELQKLPGVGRKTANVILSVAFDKPAMAVDTHVFRVAARLGLTANAKNPLQAEMQLVKYIPKEKIAIAHHWLILHGRYICIARNPQCEGCGLKNYCLYFHR